MANRYWVGGTGNWDTSDTSHWSATSGGTGGASVPDYLDAVFFDANSNEPGDGSYTVTVITGSLFCHDLIISNPSSGTLTFTGSSDLNVYGNFLLNTGITFSYSGNVFFNGSSKTITTNSAISNVRFCFYSQTGSTTLQNAISLNSIYIGRGTFNTNNFNITCEDFLIQTLYASTVNLGTSTVTCIYNWDTSNTSLLTYSFENSTINIGTVNGYGSFYGGGLSYNTVNMVGGGYIYGNNTFTNFNCNVPASINSPFLQFHNTATTQTITNLNISGYSQNSNRLRVESDSGCTITCLYSNVTMSNVDFRNITAVSSSPWSGTSIGDMHLNSNITFTTPVTRYWVGNSGAWSDRNHWSATSGGTGGASFPLPQDTCIFNNSSFSISGQTVSLSGENVGHVDWSGVTTNNPTFNIANDSYFFGNVTLSSNITFSNDAQIQFAVDNTHSIRTAGKDIKDIYIFGKNGTLTLQDDILCSTWFGISGYDASAKITVDFNDFDTEINEFYVDTANFYMGSGTLTYTGNYFELASDVNVFPETSTIKAVGLIDDFMSIYLHGYAINKLWITNTPHLAGFFFLDSGTVSELVIDAGSNVYFTENEVLNIDTLNAVGTVSSPILFDTESYSGKFYLQKPNGIVSCDYLNISHSDVGGGAYWYAGRHSTNTANNTGWRFYDKPHGLFPTFDA